MRKAKAFVIILSILLLGRAAKAADLFLEPYVGIGQMVLAVYDSHYKDYDTKDIANGFMLGCKGGFNFNQRVFAGLDYQTAGPFTFGRLVNKPELTASLLGIGAGLDYDVSRFWVGYYFNQTMQDAAHSITYKGDAWKVGFGLKVTKNLHANIEVIFHNIYSRDTTNFSAMNTNTNIQAQSAFASVSLPVDFK